MQQPENIKNLFPRNEDSNPIITQTKSTQFPFEEKCDTHGFFDYDDIVKNHERQICKGCKPLIEKNNSRVAFLEKSKLPFHFCEKNFFNYDAKSDLQKRAFNIAQNYAQNSEENFKGGKGLVLFGKPGTGKTHLAASIINKLCCDGISSFYISAIKAIRQVKETYRSDSEKSERQVLEKYKRIHFLFLDEIGRQFGTEAEKNILFEILNDRYGERLPTILISNCTYDELNLYLGEAAVDRLHETSQFVPFAWESHRKLTNGVEKQ